MPHCISKDILGRGGWAAVMSLGMVTISGLVGLIISCVLAAAQRHVFQSSFSLSFI